jgi:hypothetical protein
MQAVSLPLELLVKIVTFALDDDHEECEIGEIPEWKKPSPNTLDRVLGRESRSDTLISTAHISASGENAGSGETPRSTTNDTGKASKNITYTYTLTTALRLYVILVFRP